MSGQNLSYRYSEAFKQKVVTEIESGKYSIRESSNLYDVSDVSIRNWLRKFGKNHLIGKVVKIEMRGEADKLKQLEKEKRALESALAQAQLKIIFLESTIECADELYSTDIKKKFGTVASKIPFKKQIGKN
jgi:transposase-like protein